MLPIDINDWSVGVIQQMLESGLFESEHFDYKETLPHSGDDKAKTRLRKTCCAFANSNGGFIVFGISDDKTLPPENRIVGIDAQLDFPEHFGAYPKSCVPSIYWLFKNPPISLRNGNVIHIVQIPKSAEAPHAVGNVESGWQFTKRTNKGNEGMPIEEIRLNFLSFYEKRIKLQLLKTELESLRDNAQNGYIEEGSGDSISLVTLDTQVIESVLADTYLLTANSPNLIKALSEIRGLVRITNNKFNIITGIVHIGMTGKDKIMTDHNTFIRLNYVKIKNLCVEALNELDSLLKI